MSLTVAGLSSQAVTYFLYATTFLSVFQHTNIRTPQWLGYIVQRPESHSVHHARGIHHYNYSDLPLFDILFGTFRNPKDFVGESGFYDGASAKLRQILAFKDIAGADFDPAKQLRARPLVDGPETAAGPFQRIVIERLAKDYPTAMQRCGPSATFALVRTTATNPRGKS